MKDTTKQYLAGGIAGAAFAITMFGCAGVANAESGEVAYPNQVQSDSERQSDGSYAWVCHYASIYDSPVSTR